MKIAKKLTAWVVLGWAVSGVQAVETNSTKAIAEASFDWGTFTVTTSALPGSTGPAPTIHWIYQDTYATSNSQKNKTIGWDTSLEIAEKGISSWSKIDPSTIHSYAIDTNSSPESKSWSSSFRVGGFTVTGNGTVTFSANYSLTSSLSPGSLLPSYADSAALFTIMDLNNVEVVSQKDSVDLNNSNANASNNGLTKTNKFNLSLPVQDGQQFKFSADIHAKAGLSDPSASSNAKEAVVLGNWCANTAEDCDGAFRIDLATGKRTLISAYTKADNDKLFDEPNSSAALNRGGKWWEKAAISPVGDIFVFSDNRYDLRSNNTNKSIYRISPSDGSRQLLSNLTDPKADITVNAIPDNMVVMPTNQLLLDTTGKITAVNLATSQLSVLSDSSIASQGPAFSALLGTDPYGDLFGLAVSGLVQVDTNTGTRTAFANYGIDPAKAITLIDSTGNILSITDSILHKYNNVGSTSLISNFNDPGQGPVISNAKAINEAGDGRLVVLDGGTGTGLGKLVAIDPSTGARTLLSDFQDPANGALVYDARAIAIGSMPSFVGKDVTSGSSGNQPILSQTESVDSVLAGQAFSYLVTFSNYAPEFSTNAKLTDKLPKNTKLVSAVPSQGICKGKTTITCNFGTVASGARVVARITVIRAKAGQIKNTAVVVYKMKKTGAKKVKSFRLASSKTIVAK